MVTLTKKQIKEKTHWTIADYALLPDEMRCEIIDGTLYMSPSPRTEHQIVSRNLIDEIWPFVKRKKLGELLYAPMDVVLSTDRVVQPDIFFVTKSNLSIIKPENIQGVPNLVIEILSSTNFKYDTGLKRELYETARVPEYWIVNPAAKSIEVWVLEKDRYRLFSAEAEKGTITSKVLFNLKLKVEKVFTSI